MCIPVPQHRAAIGRRLVPVINSSGFRAPPSNAASSKNLTANSRADPYQVGAIDSDVGLAQRSKGRVQLVLRDALTSRCWLEGRETCPC